MTVSLLTKIYTYVCVYICVCACVYRCACIHLQMFLYIHLYVDFYAKVCYTILVLMLMLITYILFCTFYIDKSTYFCRNKDIWSSLCFQTFIQEIKTYGVHFADRNFNIEKGQVYIISHFKVAPAKSLYRPVSAQFMIYFTCYTHMQRILHRHSQDMFIGLLHLRNWNLMLETMPTFWGNVIY
jgi:hypothetical protein